MEKETAHNIPALRRAAAILDLLVDSDELLNAADIVKRLKIPKSTGHGLLHVMCELELIQRNIDGTFKLGTKLSKWGSRFLSNVDLVDAFHQIASEHCDLAPYTLTLSVPEGSEVVYIACRNSNAPLGFTFKIGMRLPIYFTATGKAMMASWSDAKINTLVKTHDWPQPLTPSSARDFQIFKTNLQNIRKNGYSIDNGEIRDGMICLGAAIKNHAKQAIAGIAVSLTEQEATATTIELIGSKISTTALKISKLLGYYA
ncbi:IclR family transcriptional regulator [Bartonella sp. HY761]|uniref:IclR family transcriptional regulator n=1 Tax=Bartonella sp. HY761 TaxID=2979330 RepID=UPI0021E26D11|nr:IclR family transcriptional regulator [Bartonella sp. HY761]UXN07960.1 IclR family transcriptional regulator [Bartonella sp. HY761]